MNKIFKSKSITLSNGKVVEEKKIRYPFDFSPTPCFSYYSFKGYRL